jgi:tetratricopeptide (TPR) repeat protein
LNLTVISTGALLFLLIVDPQLGMPRDWDLMGLMLFPAVLLFIRVLDQRMVDIVRRQLVPIMVLLLFSTLSFLAVNLNYDYSRRYIENIIALDTEKTLGALVILTNQYDKEGLETRADSLRSIFHTTHSRLNIYNRIMKLLDKGDLVSAEYLINLLEPDIFDGDYHWVRGRYSYLRHRYDSALILMDNAINLRKYNSDYRWQRAMIHLAGDNYDKALADFRFAYTLNRTSLRAIDGLSLFFFQTGQFDSSIVYSEKLNARRPDLAAAYYRLAGAHAMLKNGNRAKYYAGLFFEKAGADSVSERYKKEIQILIEKLRTNDNL